MIVLGRISLSWFEIITFSYYKGVKFVVALLFLKKLGDCVLSSSLVLSLDNWFQGQVNASSNYKL